MINFTEFCKNMNLKENTSLPVNKLHDFINELELIKNETEPEFQAHIPTIDWTIKLINDFFFNNKTPEPQSTPIKTVTLKGKQVPLKSLSPDQRTDILTDLFTKWKNGEVIWKNTFFHYLETYVKEMMQSGATAPEVSYYLTDTKYKNRFKIIEDWNEYVKSIQLRIKQQESEKEPEQKSMASFYNKLFVLMHNLPTNLDFKTLNEIHTYFAEKFAKNQRNKLSFIDGSIWDESNWIRTNYKNGVSS